ncbi:hypothetical protein QO010_001185 [Caulobacter ginsengisoli]|uniref:Uncharacterized protein n=1 Tax=Caulobacter ginsengisoli TaxID=400775 RepID=A0ABU0IN78_9CAUL|nr:hypothetical protein [Caulobacter ginsengisoli]MDQ0463414.1 hypothetical protein [Caulobacter ginsengisoli]
MAIDIPNFGTPDSTLVAVTLGAVLATLGGFLGNRFEARVERRQRERDAALLLGEIVFTFVMILKMAHEARQIGDPYGPITLRMLSGAMREADAYERNRERLPDLSDGALRVETHKLMVSITMSLEGMLENTRRLETLPARTPQATLEALRAGRDSGFDFIMETLPKFEPTLARFSRLAKVSFEGHEAVVRG